MMKLTSLLTSLALVSFVSCCLSYLVGTGSIELFSTTAVLFALAGMCADYSRSARVLLPLEHASARTHTLPFAA